MQLDNVLEICKVSIHDALGIIFPYSANNLSSRTRISLDYHRLTRSCLCSKLPDMHSAGDIALNLSFANKHE